MFSIISENRTDLAYSNDDEKKYISPIECYKLNIIAVYCIALFFASVITNCIQLKYFYANKKLRLPYDIFTITLSIINLIGTILELPFVILSNFYCR